jgi:hypothetical protein
MKNIVKKLTAVVGVALIFAACHKEGDLPFYKTGIAPVLGGNSTAVNSAVADSSKTAFTLNWSWPNYATDSIHQKFTIQIDSAGKNFVNPFTIVVKGVISKAFTGKELNLIVFGFGDFNKPYTLEMKVISSYGNNNEQYQSNPVSLVVTPYIIPVTLALNPTGPLTLLVANSADKAVTFNWNATQFGNVPLNYAIQIDKAGGTFTTPKVMPFGKALTGSITVNDLNNAAINAGIASNATGDLDFRVIAYQGTNFANPVYSNVPTLKVTTYLSIMTWNLPGDYVAASYPGTTFADWSPDKSPQVISSSSAPLNLEGYVYMANASNNWKFASKPSWDGPNYANNDANGVLEPGKLDPNAKNNINSPMGYYKINADAGTFTYTAVATTFGLIGNATPGGWSTDTPMTYDPALRVWKVGAALTQKSPPNDGLKFRANGAWDINYGDTGANGSLEAGGDNIGVSLDADYAVTLDLSTPNTYTYTINRWGLIGDAIPVTGWDSDQNLTWDAANKVFTITLALKAAGGFKFRANDAWTVNLGGDLNALTQDGGNLAVAADGTYKVTLDPWSHKATVTASKKK